MSSASVRPPLALRLSSKCVEPVHIPSALAASKSAVLCSPPRSAHTPPRALHLCHLGHSASQTKTTAACPLGRFSVPTFAVRVVPRELAASEVQNHQASNPAKYAVLSLLSARLSSYSNVPLMCPTRLQTLAGVISFIRPQTYIRF